MADISVLIGFHREGLYAKPALSSLADLLVDARAAGIEVEVVATLDNIDEETRRVVSSGGIDRLVEVSAGDIAGSRNAGIEAATGEFMAIVDGDDLWGHDWLTSAFSAASADKRSIWHPEYLYAFQETDLRFGAPVDLPNPNALTQFIRHNEPDYSTLDIRELAFENPWSSSSFAHNEIYRQHPYKSVDQVRGLGIEDFSWNLETLAAGFRHRVVADTVHMYRVNRPGSQNTDNNRRGYLPYLPPNFWSLRRVPS